MKKRLTLSITLILTLLAGLLTTGMAFASEGNEVEVEGEIVGIFPDEFYLEVEAEIESEIVILEVKVGKKFDFDAYDVGDLITFRAIFNDEGDLVFTDLKIKERARDRVMAQEGELAANYCMVEDVNHPVAFKIAETYGVPYEEIQGYLCGENHVPLGQIMLALQTAAISDYDFTDFMDGFENIKWGKIWQELGLKGKPDHGTPPGQIKKQDGESGKPDETPPQKGK